MKKHKLIFAFSCLCKSLLYSNYPNPFLNPYYESKDKLKVSEIYLKGTASTIGKKAIIISNGKKDWILTIGEMILDYKVNEIEEDYATLTKDDQDYVIYFK